MIAFAERIREVKAPSIWRLYSHDFGHLGEHVPEEWRFYALAAVQCEDAAWWIAVKDTVFDFAWLEKEMEGFDRLCAE